MSAPSQARRWWPGLAPDHLLREQLALIDAQSFIPLLGSWIAGIMMCWVFVGLQALQGWLIWLLLYTLLVVGVWRVFLGSRTRQWPPRRRAALMMLGMGLIGVFWGSSTILVTLAGGDMPTLFMVTTVVAGIAAGVLGFCGPCWPVYAAHLLMVVPGVNVGFWLHGGTLPTTLGLFSLLYLMFMLQFARTVESAALHTIELRFENLDLVARLRAQTRAADAARAQAEANSIDKSRFLAAASHDLRQPIHALGLFLDALGGTVLDARQRGIFTNAQAACDASREMLNTLLDFSRIEAGVVRYEPRAFALQPLLTELEREFAPQAEARGLVFRLHDTRQAAWADPALVSRILRNLMANAVRYTARGGVLVACRRRRGQVVLEVWDTGVGIAPQDHVRIFKEFQQLANPERDRSKGLGLGLAIVEGLARVMATRVSLRSVPGRGSVFRLSLPSAPAVLADSTPHDNEAMSPLTGLRVLVVDDDPAVREAMTQLLTGWQCQPQCAADLPEALALSQIQAPQVLVTDYRLRDGVTGRDVMLALRARLGPGLPCVIVTGDTAPDRLREAQDSGAVLLHKPLRAAQLYRSLAPHQVSAVPVQTG